MERNIQRDLTLVMQWENDWSYANFIPPGMAED
jgi:hypothetical protein